MMITWLILTPLAGALAVLLLPRSVSRPAALLFNLFTAGLVLWLWHGFNQADGSLQMIEHHDWIRSVGAEYRVGLDGLSLLLLLLTSLIIPFALFAQRQDRSFCALMLFVQSALFGTFTAQNFILWFLFYEMSLLPAFLLIKIWGGENRDRAATKFFVYTFLGSALMLVSFLVIYLSLPEATRTLDFVKLAELGKTGLLHGNLAWLVFAGIFIGLAVKVPLFPFHTWLPDAYASAPIGVSMVLTGLLSKMGVYGFIRLLIPLFPHEIKILAPALLTLAVCSIVFASLAAWAQTDLKRMIGYLSINHLGYCLLGLFAIGGGTGIPKEISATLSGVFMQIFNHGLTAAALFYFAGLLEQRRGSRNLHDFGGLMQRTPLLCGWMCVSMFSSLGLPGLNGFIGEFLIFKGSFALATAASSVAAIGLLVTAVVFLRAIQLIVSGPLVDSCKTIPDLALHEKLVIVPITLLMVAIGILPQFMFNFFNSTVLQMARHFGS